MDETRFYNLEEVDLKLVRETLNDVFEALEERGYNPVNQLVGYLMSGDLGYISTHKEARRKIRKLDRSKILEVLLKNCIHL